MPTGPNYLGKTSATGTGSLARFDYVTVLVSTACASCSVPFPIDAVVDGCVCPACSSQLMLPPERWREVLEPLLSRIESLPQDGKLQRTTGSFQFAAQRPACCAQCSAALPGEVLDQAVTGQSFCPACGYRMVARAVPPALTAMLPGVTHIIGEHPEMVARPLERRPPIGRGFLLRIDHALRTQYFPPDWGDVIAACGDFEGGVYVLATETSRFGQLRAIGLDSELRTRWSRPNLPMGKHQDAGITISPDGVVVWAGDRVSAIKLALADGRDLGRLGGQQPAKADRHFLDLNGAQSLAGDFDGTFLLTKERRLARCAADGTGVATWPPRRSLFGKKQEKLVAFGEDVEGEDMAPMVDRLPDYPTQVYRARLVVGWDQRLYLASGPHIACIERDGKVRWRCSLPQGWYVDYAAAADGQVYVLSGKELPAIWRISADGRQATVIVDGRSHQTPLAESAMVVRRDGTILTFAERGQIRMFAANGQLYWRTDAARIADEQRVAKASIAAYGLPKSGDV
jgi:DNA-directed RNA polymerase subunit RPC12/RpoP/outer membrane protein assembly factor BamB